MKRSKCNLEEHQLDLHSIEQKSALHSKTHAQHSRTASQKQAVLDRPLCSHKNQCCMIRRFPAATIRVTHCWSATFQPQEALRPADDQPYSGRKDLCISLLTSRFAATRICGFRCRFPAAGSWWPFAFRPQTSVWSADGHSFPSSQNLCVPWLTSRCQTFRICATPCWPTVFSRKTQCFPLPTNRIPAARTCASHCRPFASQPQESEHPTVDQPLSDHPNQCSPLLTHRFPTAGICASRCSPSAFQPRESVHLTDDRSSPTANQITGKSQVNSAGGLRHHILYSVWSNFIIHKFVCSQSNWIIKLFKSRWFYYADYSNVNA